MEPNQELIEQTLDWLEANPDHMNMNYFVGHHYTCGTTLCFGGAAYMLGKRLDLSYMDNINESISYPAQQLLGLDDGQADAIFYTGATIRTPAQLRWYVKEVLVLGPSHTYEYEEWLTKTRRLLDQSHMMF